jgi:hypothetical protein
MYLGGSIMSAILPYAAFIVIAGALFFAYRRPHSVPRPKYLAEKRNMTVRTPEPGKQLPPQRPGKRSGGMPGPPSAQAPGNSGPQAPPGSGGPQRPGAQS